ncbi:MAG: nuclear transport factor 2 family protein [Acidobacteria bacterium]|nr:nuclear transport factor 2 family protein [Acidobacteriota bacterium]
MVNRQDPRELVHQFIDHINAHDASALADLMSEDHRFIDATGACHCGREEMRGGWEQYFACFPDYRVDIEEEMVDDGVVAVFGWASGTYSGTSESDAPKTWRIPAAWRARTRDGHVTEWRVWSDIEPMTRSMGIRRETRQRL